MTNESRHIHGWRVLPEVLKVGRGTGPIGQVGTIVEHAFEFFTAFGRRSRHPTIADDNGCDTTQDFESHITVRHKREIIVRVRVDKTGCKGF